MFNNDYCCCIVIEWGRTVFPFYIYFIYLFCSQLITYLHLHIMSSHFLFRDRRRRHNVSCSVLAHKTLKGINSQWSCSAWQHLWWGICATTSSPTRWYEHADTLPHCQCQQGPGIELGGVVSIWWSTVAAGVLATHSQSHGMFGHVYKSGQSHY